MLPHRSIVARMNDFFADVKKSVEDIERRAQRDKERAFQKLYEEFDADIEVRRQKQEAIEKRQVTLRKEWIAQMALKENNIPMDDWMDYRLNLDFRGKFRKKVHIYKILGKSKLKNKLRIIQQLFLDYSRDKKRKSIF